MVPRPLSVVGVIFCFINFPLLRSPQKDMPIGILEKILSEFAWRNTSRCQKGCIVVNAVICCPAVLAIWMLGVAPMENRQSSAPNKHCLICFTQCHTSFHEWPVPSDWLAWEYEDLVPWTPNRLSIVWSKPQKSPSNGLCPPSCHLTKPFLPPNHDAFLSLQKFVTTKQAWMLNPVSGDQPVMVPFCFKNINGFQI